MIAKLKELRKDESGFTLIELMVVVLIIGILAAIAIPVFLNLQKEGLKASVKSDVKNTVTVVATELAKSSGDLDAALLATVPVQTDSNVVTVAADGTDGNYTVTGVNVDADNFTYTFTSSNGQYVGS